MDEPLRYIPIAEYEIGCCHSGQPGRPYKTVLVKADALAIALALGRRLLQPSTIESVCHVATRPNPDHVATLVRAGLLPAEPAGVAGEGEPPHGEKAH